MLVAVVAKYAGASMSSISSLPCMLSQWPAFVRRKRKKNQLHGELSAATLSSHFFLSSLNEYRLKARNNLQFKAHTTNHVVLCLRSQYKARASEVFMFGGCVQTQSEDALLRRRMLMRSRCMRFSVLMLKRPMERRPTD